MSESEIQATEKTVSDELPIQQTKVIKTDSTRFVSIAIGGPHEDK